MSCASSRAGSLAAAVGLWLPPLVGLLAGLGPPEPGRPPEPAVFGREFSGVELKPKKEPNSSKMAASSTSVT